MIRLLKNIHAFFYLQTVPADTQGLYNEKLGKRHFIKSR